MQPLLIFRHIACEGPGYLGDVLGREHIPYKVVSIDQGDPLPTSIANVSGLVFMGGPMSVNDPLPWVEAELALIRSAAETGIPVLGHCLGGQLIAKALGGTIQANPVKEIGWHPVEHVDNACARDWLADLPARFDAFHWHGETFTLPAGATPILRSQYCENQAFVLDNILALQCHVEMKADMVAEWAGAYAHELAQPSESVQSAEEMTQNLPARIGVLQTAADVLYQRWLRPLM